MAPADRTSATRSEIRSTEGTRIDRRSALRLTATAAAGAGLATAAAAPAHAAPARAGEFVLTGKRTSANIPSLLTPGTPYFVHFELTDADGRPAGTENAYSIPVTVDTDGALILSTLVLRLNDGLITANSAFQRPLPAVTEVTLGFTPWSHTFAVTGGTGAYTGASGTIAIDHSSKDDDRLTVTLT